MKRCSTALDIRENASENHNEIPYIPTKMAKIIVFLSVMPISWKQHKCPLTDKYKNRSYYSHKMEYYSVTKYMEHDWYKILESLS